MRQLQHSLQARNHAFFGCRQIWWLMRKHQDDLSSCVQSTVNNTFGVGTDSFMRQTRVPSANANHLLRRNVILDPVASFSWACTQQRACPVQRLRTTIVSSLVAESVFWTVFSRPGANCNDTFVQWICRRAFGKV
jgi:hypothetical protein